MKIKASKLLKIFIIIIFPSTLFAQQQETVISADQISIQPDNILRAKGNVYVKRGDVSIRAEAMIVNEEVGQIEFQEIIEFSDGKALKLTGQDAVLSDDLSSGIITAAKVLIDDTIRIRAKKIKIKNSTLERADGINRITSCDECESGFPLWFFTASSATNNVKNQNIVYRDVTLRVSGVPIGYIPYLRLPNPNVNRARGFLIPGLIITSNLGIGAKLPYFIPIGDSRDVLLTPHISPKTKTIEYRYRQKFSNGDLTIKGALSQDDISNKDIRTYYEGSGNFELAYGVKLKIDAGQTNDDTYLGDYSYTSENDLDTNISLGKALANQESLFTGDLNYVRDKKDDSTLEEFYFLSGVYKKRFDQTLLSGNLFFEAEVNSGLNVTDGSQVRRPPSLAATEVRYSNNRNVGPVKILGQSFSRVTSFVNSENIESLQEEFIFKYGVSSIFSIPLYKSRNSILHQLVPKFMLSYNGQEGRTKGDYFVGKDQLSIGNIYDGNKITSSSESELGISVAGGLEYRINWDDRRALDLLLGGAWIQDVTTIQKQNSQFQPKTINYVGRFKYQSNTDLMLTGDTLISNEGKILNAGLSNEVQIKDHKLNSEYEFISAQTDERINKDLETLNLSYSYTGFENLGASFSRRYDLSESAMASSKSSLTMKFSARLWDYQFSQTFDRQQPEKTQISAIYDDDCTRIKISLQNESQKGGSSESIQTLLLSFQLKPFAGVSVPGL